MKSKRAETTDKHGRPLCGAKLSSGEGTCKNLAGFGTAHPGLGMCKMHLGNTRSGNVAAVREGARKGWFPWADASREIDPGEALLEEVHRCAGRVVELGEALKQEEDFALALALLKQQDAERERMARTSQMAIAAGISERMVRLAEMQVDATLQLVEGVLTDLGLTLEQQELARVSMAKRLRAVG